VDGEASPRMGALANRGGDHVQTPRFEALLTKRNRIGLSDQEANELGRLFAEREGKPYSNASTLRAAARARRMRPLDRFRKAGQPPA
jgi:hypothetical protein